jgi:dolichol-phosphate mannosyltransferase
MIVIMDADDTHDPVYVPQMIQRIQDLDVVIASRYSPGGGQPGLSLSRKIASDGANTILRGLFPIKGVREYTNSFRLYRAEVIRNAIQIYRDRFVESNGFTCMAEILIKLHRSGARISEIPFILDYSRKKGKSKLPILKTIMQYIALISKMMIKRCGKSENA